MKYLKYAILLITLSSCQTIAGPVAELAHSYGLVNESQKETIKEVAAQGDKVMEDITPEQEYYIGRAVGATILEKYKVLEDADANIYINKIGKALTLFSDRPETYGGYSFLILDSEEINAFAAPSGHIFISKGMLKLTKNEDEIAAILAHEISHVNLKHGLEAIKSSRITGFITLLGTSALKEFASEDIAELTTMFEDSITDITSTLINSGYSREFEREADRLTISILERTGYDKYALIRIIKRMSKYLEPDTDDFSKTHPDPQERVEDIKESRGVSGEGVLLPPSARYLKYLESII